MLSRSCCIILRTPLSKVPFKLPMRSSSFTSVVASVEPISGVALVSLVFFSIDGAVVDLIAVVDSRFQIE